MNDDQKNEITITRHISVLPEIIDTPNDFVFYSNVTSVQVSPEEIVVQFGLIKPSNPARSASVARAYMTPSHAKRLMVLLAGMVEQYESAFGPIITNHEDRFTPEARKRLGVSEQ